MDIKRIKVLLVSPIECYPEFYGSSARISSFVKIINQLEDVDLLYLHLPERSFNVDLMNQRLNDKYIYKKFKKKLIVQFKLRLRMLVSLFFLKKETLVRIDDFIQYSDIVFFKKTYNDFKPNILIINYSYYSKLFDYAAPNCLKILDTHDSLYNRFNLIYNSRKTYKKLRISLEDEISCLNRSDIVLSIQKKEEMFFRENGCSKEVVTIGHIKDFYQSDYEEYKYRILYIGANYSANIESLQNFLVNFWPLVSRHFKCSIKLLVVGDIKDSVQFDHDSFSNSTVSFLGRIDNLNEIYDQVDFSINPILFGSGLKIKNIESLSMGKPIVTMPYGLDGLETFLDKGVFVVNDVVDWIRIFEKLYIRDCYNESIQEINNLYQDYFIENKVRLQNLVYNN
jgi:hypothetical protein